MVLIPTTPSDAFVGLIQRWPHANRARTLEQPDNRGLAGMFQLGTFAPQARAILLAFGNSGGSKNLR
jgi:hypothetical protein